MEEKEERGRLVLCVKPGEKIFLGEEIEISYKKEYDRVKILIDAPKSIRIIRESQIKLKNMISGINGI